MIYDIDFAGFDGDLSTVIDKQNFEAFKITEVPNRWVVRKSEALKEREFIKAVEDKINDNQ